LSTRIRQKYPIYIPSKSRYLSKDALTIRTLQHHQVPYYLVVEPQQYDEYASRWGEEGMLTLPWNNPGSVIPARNWIKEHAIANGYERHWQLDDNIRGFRRLYKGQRIPARPGLALRVVEDFTDRYKNIGISGMNYTMFGVGKLKPFQLNHHVYSCCLINNALPHKWRGRYNEDADICLQVLADGWCTVLVNVFLVEKIATMKHAGGNTQELYGGDGRAKMARSLERMWPGVVTTGRRFHRPQHVIKDAWKRFDTPLILKEGIELQPEANEYGMRLAQTKDKIKGKGIQKLLDEYGPRQEPTQL
jgi:hypothetical protein